MSQALSDPQSSCAAVYGAKKYAGFEAFAEEVDPEVVVKLDEAEAIRVSELKLAGGHDTCARRSLPNVSGPLRSMHAGCFKGRPRPRDSITEPG